MNAVGIDIARGWSMVSVLSPCGDVVYDPFVVRHSPSEMKELISLSNSLNGESRIVMECTGVIMSR